MTGRAIWGNISTRVTVLARAQRGSIENQRAGYFPILPDTWSAIIDLVYDFVQIRKVAEL